MSWLRDLIACAHTSITSVAVINRNDDLNMSPFPWNHVPAGPQSCLESNAVTTWRCTNARFFNLQAENQSRFRQNASVGARLPRVRQRYRRTVKSTACLLGRISESR